MVMVLKFELVYFMQSFEFWFPNLNVELAQELEFTEDQIHQIRAENPNSLQDQSHALLKYWMDRGGDEATGRSPSRKHYLRICTAYTVCNGNGRNGFS